MPEDLSKFGTYWARFELSIRCMTWVVLLIPATTHGADSSSGSHNKERSPAQASRPALPESAAHRNRAPIYYPPPDSEGGWRSLADAEEIHRVVRMDKQKLDEAFAIAESSTRNGGLLIVHKGWLVYERYFGKGWRDATPNLASCGKSFTSVAVGIMISERPDLFPDGLDQKVFTPRYLPAEAFPLPDPAMEDIRLGQLLAFSAGIRGNNPCYVNGKEVTINPAGPDGYKAMIDEVALGRTGARVNEPPLATATLWCKPGGGYSYATASAHIASIVVRHVTGMELEEYLRTRLARPMGWGEFGFGYGGTKGRTHTPGGGGIAVRATDMLRFGYLLLQEGRWNDRQLVPAEYVRRCGRKSAYNPHYPYSLCFNVNTDGEVRECPRDTFWKGGSGGHVFFVIPSLDLVIWKLAGRDDQYDQVKSSLPFHPGSPKASQSRREWKPTVGEDVAWRQILEKVIESIEKTQ